MSGEEKTDLWEKVRQEPIGEKDGRISFCIGLLRLGKDRFQSARGGLTRNENVYYLERKTSFLS